MHLNKLPAAHFRQTSLCLLVALLVCLPVQVFSQDDWSRINPCSVQRLKGKGSLASIAFLDEMQGVLGGDGGLVRYTRNGGITWSSPSFAPLFANTPTGFGDNVQKIVADNDRFLLLSYKFIFVSTDGGAQWNHIPASSLLVFNEFGKSVNTFFYDVALVENKATILGAAYDQVGKNFLGSFILRFDLAKVNSPPLVRRIMPNNIEFLQIFFTDDNSDYGWIVGKQGSIQNTTDGGKKWFPEENIHFYSTFPDSNDQSAVYPDQSATQAARPRLNGIYFLDKSHGWVVGENGTILYTKSGGREWDGQRLPPNISTGKPLNFYQVQFADHDHGWIVGSGGTILKTENGGDDWSPIHAGSETLYALYLDNIYTGWAVGTDDTLLRYDARYLIRRKEE